MPTKTKRNAKDQRMIHVHIVPAGRRFNLRVGLFKSFVGWQTAEAAGLKIPVKCWNCFDNLTRKQAEEIAPKLDAWLLPVGAFLPPSQRKITAKQRKLNVISEKLQATKIDGAAAGGSRFI